MSLHHLEMVPVDSVAEKDALLEVVAPHLSPRHLNLILLPTEQCNFRCAYCYERFVTGRMQPAVVAGVRALLSTRISELDSAGQFRQPLGRRTMRQHSSSLTNVHRDPVGDFRSMTAWFCSGTVAVG